MKMVETVARALCAQHYADRFGRPVDDEHVVRNVASNWPIFKEQAIVAIEAMMEPTNGMLGEAAKAMSPGRRPTPEFVSVNQKHKIRYQAMIRKALEE